MSKTPKSTFSCQNSIFFFDQSLDFVLGIKGTDAYYIVARYDNFVHYEGIDNYLCKKFVEDEVKNPTSNAALGAELLRRKRLATEINRPNQQSSFLQDPQEEDDDDELTDAERFDEVVEHVTAGYADEVKAWIQSGGDVTWRFDIDDSLFHVCIENRFDENYILDYSPSHLEILEMLSKANTSQQAMVRNGFSAAQLAVWHGDAAALKVLLLHDSSTKASLQRVLDEINKRSAAELEIKAELSDSMKQCQKVWAEFGEGQMVSETSS